MPRYGLARLDACSVWQCRDALVHVDFHYIDAGQSTALVSYMQHQILYYIRFIHFELSY